MFNGLATLIRLLVANVTDPDEDAGAPTDRSRYNRVRSERGFRMPPQTFPSVPGFQAWNEFARLLQAQNKILETLPGTLLRLTNVLEKIAPAANDAVETVSNSRRVTERVNVLIDELEGPIRDLIPAINRVTEILNDPAIAEIPITIARVQAEANPILDGIGSVRNTASSARDRGRRMVDGTVRRIRRTPRPG